MGLSFKDFLPARELAAYIGITLLSPSLVAGLPDDQLNRLLGKDKSKWSGATFRCDNHNFIIFNEAHAPVRQESTIMHEIAHILCDHKPTIPLEFSNMNLLLRDYNSEHEAEADWLGGCLQLPREGLLWALRKGMSTTDIASTYGASVAMTNYRIGKSGVKIQVEHSKKYY